MPTDPPDQIVRPKYDWDTWFDGNEHYLEEGIQYVCARRSMIVMIRTKAGDRNIRVSIRQMPKGLRIRKITLEGVKRA